MVSYRRNRVTGGTYFFTVTLRDRDSRLLTEYICLLRQAFRHTRQERPFRIEAVVVLPDHLHTVWTLPDDDDDYPARWQLLKSRFSRASYRVGVAAPQNPRGEYRIWQRRYWEHTIRDTTDFQRHVDYIHFNPVKHKLVQRVIDWRHSSFHWFVKRGIYPADWAGGGPFEVGGKFGE
jgi:putative transposase